MSAQRNGKSAQFVVRLLHADRDKLDRMATEAGASRGEVIKYLIRTTTPEQVRGWGVGVNASDTDTPTPVLAR